MLRAPACGSVRALVGRLLERISPPGPDFDGRAGHRHRRPNAHARAGHAPVVHRRPHPGALHTGEDPRAAAVTSRCRSSRSTICCHRPTSRSARSTPRLPTPARRSAASRRSASPRRRPRSTVSATPVTTSSPTPQITSRTAASRRAATEALLETNANLRAAGIKPVGTGNNLVEARSPAVVIRNGVAFAFLAYDDIASYYHAGDGTPGAAPLDPDTIAEDVANARKVANVVIVIPHWGVEYTTEPSDRQRAFARAAAAAGADMVVGNHPHSVQAHERIGGTFVAYALGNFVFDQSWSLETQQGALLEATFTGTRLTSTRYLPVHIYDQYQPRLAPPDEAQQILDRIESASTAAP